MQKVTYKGKQYKSLTLACDLLGVNVATVSQYVKRGMSIEQSIEQILKNKKRNNCTDHLGNEFESLKSMAISYWLPPSILYARLNRKWDLKRALTTPVGKPRGKSANG